MGVTFPFFVEGPRLEPIRGFHATTQGAAARLLAGAPFTPSLGDGEWLGHGVYFWTDEAMAWWWADSRNFKSPAVVEAGIVLGYCLDLTNAFAVRSFVAAVHRRLLDDLPDTEAVPENEGDHRQLDCAVLNKAAELTYPRLDSILAHFADGDPVFPGATFLGRNHVQVCVRKLSNILYPKEVGRKAL